ncbi:deiodinase-like protein [Nocardiopsis sp. FIRDI 009]|uniref:deiodinase-like protein n=1 Tax=Nocardiopsis sp. FIRDI 009 TaxID=714197 RepID=UPI00130082FC|nr:deiodinase-like protein [Nocardiopsis sp. FIRDI 009]
MGRQAIDATLYDVEGRSIELSSLWREWPVVIEFGSISCPIFVDKLEPMAALARRFSGDVDFYVVYVREAHPGRRYPAHREFDQKLRHAHDLVRLESMARTVLVDDVEGTMPRDYGALPDSVFVIGVDGIVSMMADWNDPSRLAEHLSEVVERGGRGDAVHTLRLTDNFQRPNLRLLRQLNRVLSRVGAPALRDFLRQVPALLRERLRARGPRPGGW